MNGVRGRICPADTMAELMKLLRDEWLCVSEVAEHMEAMPDTVSRWLKRLNAQGLLERKQKKTRFRHVRAYRVSPNWRSEPTSTKDKT